MEIKICEFAKILYSGLVVDVGCLFASLVRAKTNQFIINSYSCLPVIVICMNTLKAASIIYISSTVLAILCMCAVAEVVREIVQGIMISMIALHPIWRIRNYSVHQNIFLFSQQSCRSSHGIKRFRMRIIARVPLELIEHLKPLICNLCDLALRKGNSFHFILQKEAARSDRGSYQNERAFKILGWLFPADIANYIMNGAF